LKNTAIGQAREASLRLELLAV